ncbi:DUF5309 family protein [Candidatus Pacearchaeota archaeon]|nr:DUF5309 family protein [Candidatus Pacearchaeota archaeon]
MAFGKNYNNATDKIDSLLSILKDYSPNTDNYFMSNLAVAPAATNALHEWGVFNTARATSVTGAIEGGDPTFGDLTSPERTNNYTIIVDEPVQLSDTAKNMGTITGEDPLAFQKDQALKRLKNSMEFVTINGDVVARLSGIASGMNGIDSMISSNFTRRSSGVSFTEVELNDMMENSYDQVAMDYIADLIVCPMVISRRISGFTSNLTRNIDASDKKLVNQIRVYDSQVGSEVKIIPHKDVLKTAGTLTVYALREDTWAHSFLVNSEPRYEELAKTGHSEKGMYTSEFTTVSFAQRASVKRTGYATTI